MHIEESKVNEYLKRITPPNCPLCGGKNWTVSPKVFQLLEYHKEALVAKGAVVPVVPLTCVNCGNTYLINALIAKLIEQPKQKDNTEKTEGGE